MRLQLGLLAAATSLACATAPKGPADAPERIEFSLPDLAGKPVSPADFLGKVVIVDLWATWCVPCVQSFPFYEDLLKKHGPEGLVILAVSVDEGESNKEVERFLETHNVSFTILRDPKGTLPEKLKIDTMPTAAILGRDGRVVKIHAGFRTGDRGDIEELVKHALAASAAPPPATPEPGDAKP